MKMFLSLVTSVIFITLFSNGEAARILAVFTVPSVSHQRAFRPLTEELAKRGHEIVVITADPAFPKGQTPANLTEIDVHEVSYSTWKKASSLSSRGIKNDHLGMWRLALNIFADIFDDIMQVNEVKELIAGRQNKFDLIIIDAVFRPALGFSHRFSAPVILFSSCGAYPGNFELLGTPTHPILYPTIDSVRTFNFTQWEKTKQIYFSYVISSFPKEAEINDNRIVKKHFGDDAPTITELSKNVDMLFLNMNPMFDGNRPVPPNVVYVGSLHQNEARELPKELKTYLDSSEKDVIYLSFGTNVYTELLPTEKVQILVKVFSQLPYNVIMKYDGDLQNKADNIRTSKWFPQPDLLRHPKLKLFITQGGLQSTDESIEAGVPLIGIPMLADQWFNVEKYLMFGIGLMIDFEELTEDKLRTAIYTIMENDSIIYRTNIIKLRELMNDQPQRPLEHAVWWTEHVLRHGGAKHLRSPAANITWTEYLELELVFTVLACLTILLLFIVNIPRVVLVYITRDCKLKGN